MAPKFGTSGLRGLVTELTEDLVTDYTTAFLAACPHGGAVHVGRDLRPSSPQIAEWVLRAIEGAGVQAIDCGVLPTPALALSSLDAGQAAIMVTGSHIPADRNGLKFYVPTGEITKPDEEAITANRGKSLSRGDAPQRQTRNAVTDYTQRYVIGFGEALRGLRVGVYQHSSVARDVMVDVLRTLGAEAVPLARSNTFIPVDTEALDPDTRAMLAGWCAENGLDAIISTDGDADRPMVADAAGRVIPGDVLGALTARALGAKVLCTPVSSNTMISHMPEFERITLTRIGSPYVIAAMEDTLAQDSGAKVVGYEANGGFLLGFEAHGPAGPLAPLLTRDCLLPILAPLAEAAKQGISLAALADALPPRFTAADRIAGIETDRSKAFIAALSADADTRASFFRDTGSEARLDETDGLRVTFASGDIVHLRPSGNAPEFRCYAEAGSAERALELVTVYLKKLRHQLAD
ncbi:phosphomannomutase [Primorskyibacter sp. 2E107]|uniref:phosphomannomutase n=1 Tax=Primorskyibacter sp. 2E107 TaxID=3403458 RepID=UPI003AF8CC4F